MATTAPLKSRGDIEKVRSILIGNRDRALFTLGINTAFRGGDLLKLSIGDVARLSVGDDLVVTEQKTGKKRRVTFNRSCVETVQALISERRTAGALDGDPLFVSVKRNRLTIVSLSRMWKAWCEAAGLDGNFASHSGRKSFGYLARTEGRASIEVLMKAYGHSNAGITLTYLCIQDAELKSLYASEL